MIGCVSSYTYWINRQIAQLQKCEPITEAEVQRLCLKAREILIEEGNVQHVDSPVTVCAYAPDICPPSDSTRYVVIYTDNSLTYWSCSSWGDSAQRRITYSWVRPLHQRSTAH